MFTKMVNQDKLARLRMLVGLHNLMCLRCDREEKYWSRTYNNPDMLNLRMLTNSFVEHKQVKGNVRYLNVGKKSLDVAGSWRTQDRNILSIQLQLTTCAQLASNSSRTTL